MYSSVTRFIRDLYQEEEKFLPLHEPRFLGNEKKYLLDTIDSTFVSSVGQYVNRFEEMMCEITGAKYAVAMVNGTAALHIALKLVGVNQGDEVLSQPLTFVATANAISYEKAIPHFIDVDKDTMGLSPDALQTRLEEVAEMREGYCYNKETGNRIIACVPMHTFGLPARIDEIVTICDKYNIAVIEDAAESLGSTYKGKHTGVFGKVGTFSFNGNKTVTCGGGGAIVTDDEELGKKAKYITTTAKIPHPWEYAHSEIGYNYRMPNLNAALACAQLEQLENFIQNKRATADAYQEFFKSIDNISYIAEPKNAQANFWLNAIQFPSKNERDDFLKYSNDQGVMTRPIWQLMNRLIMFKDCPKGDLSVAESLEETIVNITSSVRI
ncbi:LegC family aminotransferase [Saprospiraceae bacterium]|nr:LegC family aminotransferase [Saprospiraceae bacterium]